MNNKLELIGIRFGTLVVIELDHLGERNRTYWKCQCDCGNTSVVKGSNLVSGGTSSCGCRGGHGKFSHEMSGSGIYRAWGKMRSRLFNKNYAGYENYGGRGISCCDKWKTFRGFYEDMGPSYKDGLTLERKHPNGDYCKENCEWIPLEEQPYNKTKRKDNKSGYTGVFLNTQKDGRQYWQALWADPFGKKSNRKLFSVKKLGFDEAKALAIEYRDKMIRMLIEQGVPYKPTHGVAKDDKTTTD